MTPHSAGCLRMKRAYKTTFCFCKWIEKWNKEQEDDE